MLSQLNPRESIAQHIEGGRNSRGPMPSGLVGQQPSLKAVQRIDRKRHRGVVRRGVSSCLASKKRIGSRLREGPNAHIGEGAGLFAVVAHLDGMGGRGRFGGGPGHGGKLAAGIVKLSTSRVKRGA